MPISTPRLLARASHNPTVESGAQNLLNDQHHESQPLSILNTTPAWTKGDLRRLGEALAAGRSTADMHERYNAVMLWHNDLAAEVAATLYTTNWQSCPPDRFDITARPKTIDTLVQKLQRERKMTLDEVQDLAGVRIDADITLDVQTALAGEIAAHFGERSRVRDLRDNPHSGYRAVHVWLRLPAGRVEIQIRTVGQSAWANTYERIGDLLGRGIRYNEMPEDPTARETVVLMHQMSDALARNERFKVELAAVRAELKVIQESILAKPSEEQSAAPNREVATRLEEMAQRARKMENQQDAAHAEFVSTLNEVRRMLDSA
ncbi:hypothetical protein VST63_18310 [Mycolicibacterium sp. 050232]|uniref:hypothetical protein n=1 Tax=Mycolicibacterium sp. 050232 TaxID=3113982 RepID=UPI002E2C1DEF|nr:hypothetical protein [Mycolicibacterium sp. 050232]MED5814319.1 hypothetical protein [Mycolicibacterium sp. 050232]